MLYPTSVIDPVEATILASVRTAVTKIFFTYIQGVLGSNTGRMIYVTYSCKDVSADSKKTSALFDYLLVA